MKWRKWTGLIVAFALLLSSMPLMALADSDVEEGQEIVEDDKEAVEGGGESQKQEDSTIVDGEGDLETGPETEEDPENIDDEEDDISEEPDDEENVPEIEEGEFEKERPPAPDEEIPPNTEESNKAGTQGSILDNVLPDIRFKAENISVRVNQSDFDLLTGITATDEDGQPVEVFVWDDGGFDIEQPGSYTITYAAEHPLSSETFRTERTIAVVVFLYDPQPVSAEEVQALVDAMEPGLEGLLALPKWEFAIDEAWLPSGWLQDIFTDEDSGAEYWRLTMGIMALAGPEVSAGTAQALQNALNSRTGNELTVLITDDLHLSELSSKYIHVADAGNAGTGATITLKSVGTSPVTIYGSGTTGINHFHFGTTSSSTAALDGYTLIFDNVILDGAGTGGGISIPADAANIVVEGAVIQNCSQALGGAVRVHANAVATFKDCTIKDNTGTIDGGAFYIVNGADVTIVDCEINNNNTGGNGGAIYAGNDVSLKIQESIVRENTAQGHGGAISFTDSNAALELIDFCRIVKNQADGNGGGIYLKNAEALYMNGDTDTGRKAPDDPQDPASPIIERNSAGGSGGGIYFDIGSYSTATAITANRRTLVRYNDADGDGAGIWSNGSNITIDNDCHLYGNDAGGNGGGLWMGNSAGGQREIKIYGNTRVLSNTAKNGGGIYAEQLTAYSNISIDVYQSWINTNQASQDGGAIYLKNNGDSYCFLVFKESTAQYNGANNGGAFYLSTKGNWTQVELVNASLAANIAQQNGGAIYAEAIDANQSDPDIDLYI